MSALFHPYLCGRKAAEWLIAMEIGQVIEIIVGVVCTLGFGLGFYFYGIWAGRQTEKPLGFWANGEKLDPKKVTDIPAYNLEFGRMFRRFSVLPCVSGVLMIMSAINNSFAVLSLIVLVLWGTVGIWWLIHSYKDIEKRYILR